MTEPVRHLFLDLEDTIISPVIDGWFNTRLKNVAKIKSFIADFKPHFMHVFSFAIWDEAQRERFNMGTRAMIERALGMSFTEVPTVDGEILPTCCRVLGLAQDSLTFSDMSDFWGKHEAFRLNMRHMWKSGQTSVEVVLLDDAVYNETFEWPNLQVKGRILNIDEMKEPNGNDQPNTEALPSTN
jgi:hypothetical protein